MTRQVVSVLPDESVFDAARLMLEKKISGLPVVDDMGNLIGVVTEGDFLRRAEIGTKRPRPRWVEFFMGPGRLADEYVRFSGRKVGDVMTRDVRAVASDTPLSDVVRLMERHNIKRVPVVEGGKIVGIVTRANLLHAMASFVHEVAPPRAEDTVIREQLLAELATQPWAPVTAIDVTVSAHFIAGSCVSSALRLLDIITPILRLVLISLNVGSNATIFLLWPR